MTSSRLAVLFALFSVLAILDGPATAQVPSKTSQLAVRPMDRISRVIDDRARVARTGNRHPWARPEFDAGLATSDTRMDRMLLLLKPDATQQNELEGLLEAQQDPASPEYHQWLSPETFGQRFGASERDVEQIVDWLAALGFGVEADA